MPTECIKQAPRAHKSKILLSEESTYGVYQAGQVPVRTLITSESLKEKVKAAGTQHGIETGSRPAQVGKIGRRDQRGEIITEMITNGWGPLLLKHATTNTITTTTGSGGRKNHVGIVGTLPTGLSVDKVLEYPDGTIFNQRFLGCRVNSLSVRIGGGRATELRAALIGRQRTELTSQPSPQRFYPQDPVLIGENFSILYDRNNDSVTELLTNVTRAQFTITNGLGTEAYPIEDGGLRDRIPQGQRRISGRIQMMFTQDDEQIIDAWLTNDPRYLILKGVMTSDVDQFVIFEFPAAVVRGTPTPQVVGRGLIRLDWPFIADYDATSGYEFKWTVQNLESGIDTATITRI